MFRNLFLLVAIGLVVWIISGFIRRAKLNTPKKTISKDMVQCDYCKTYLPRDEAISQDERSFCSQQHLNDWNQDS